MRSRVLAVAVLAASLGLPTTTADAATHTASVKVKVIGRSGKAVPATVDLVDVATGKRFTVAAGKSKNVPTGTYVIGSYIIEGKKVTLAARTVHVDHATSLTFDARDGKKVTASVNQKHAKVRRVSAALSVHTPTGDLPLDETTFLDPDAHPSVYAIPAHGGSARLSLAVTLTDSSVSPSPWRFDLARTSKGIPKNLELTGTKAKLARVDLDLHTPDPDLTPWVDLAPLAGGGGYFGMVMGGAPQPSGVRAPQHLRSYRTPNVVWRTLYTAAGHGRGTQVIGFGRPDGNLQPYRAGHTYAETWGGGVWGINAADLDFGGFDGKVWGEAFSPLCSGSVAEPLFAFCSSDATASFRLFSGATQLADGAQLFDGVTAPAGWYDLQLDGTRPTGASTSTAFTARWHTYIDTAASLDDDSSVERGMITLATPGLNGHNAAAKGSTTRVTMSVTGFTATTSEDLAYSTDGTTWTPLTLTKSGANWVADIPNPAVAGGVSLRANAAGASGSTVTETITNAWRVE